MPGFEEGLLLPAEKPDAWLEYLRGEGYAFDTVEAAYQPGTSGAGDSALGRSHAPARYTAEQSQTAFLTREVVDYIQAADRSWFVHLSYLRPHPPFIAPEPYNTMVDPDTVPPPVRASAPTEQAEKHPWLASALGLNGDWFDPWIREILGDERYELEMRQIRATYYGLIAKVDHYVGSVVRCLKETGQYDDTLIVVTSDHGELLGDQWLFGKRGFFDTGFAIPLIMRVPGMEPAVRGRVFDEFTESVDVMPTILDWLGLATPRQCDGHSLLPFASGGAPEDWRTEVHWEYDFRDVADDALEKELGISMDHCQLNVIRDRRHKYVHFTNLPPLFFDLETDPAECHNLAESAGHAPYVLEMCRKMLSWRMANDERAMTDTIVTRERIYSRRALD
jgi:arylsulfatase A-like enzyme